jgi:hypothetical protein
MTVLDFFEYLAAHVQTSELAHELAAIWTASGNYEPAA